MNSTIFSWYLFLYLTLKLCEEHIHNKKRMTSGCSQRNNTPFNDVAQISDLSHREMGDIIVSELNFDIPKKKNHRRQTLIWDVYHLYILSYLVNGASSDMRIIAIWLEAWVWTYSTHKKSGFYANMLICRVLLEHSWVSVAHSASLCDLRVPWSNEWSYCRYILSDLLSFMSCLTIDVFFSWFHGLSFSMGHIWRNAFELLSAELQRVAWLF